MSSARSVITVQFFVLKLCTKIHSAYSTEYNVQGTGYSVWCAKGTYFSELSTVYSEQGKVHCVLWVHCTVHRVQCIVKRIQRTVGYSAQNIMLWVKFTVQSAKVVMH